jgi:hypothetical protein
VGLHVKALEGSNAASHAILTSTNDHATVHFNFDYGQYHWCLVVGITNYFVYYTYKYTYASCFGRIFRTATRIKIPRGTCLGIRMWQQQHRHRCPSTHSDNQHPPSTYVGQLTFYLTGMSNCHNNNWMGELDGTATGTYLITSTSPGWVICRMSLLSRCCAA